MTMQVKMEMFVSLDSKEVVYTRTMDLPFAPRDDDHFYFDRPFNEEGLQMEAEIYSVDWFVTGSDQSVMPVIVLELAGPTIEDVEYLLKTGWRVRDDKEKFPFVPSST